jgi:hypothetical protein
MTISASTRPWWRHKRVWLIAGVGWIVALINCVAFVAASLGGGDSAPSTASYAQTCDQVTALSLAAIQQGGIAEMLQLNQRWNELGCP